MLFGDGPRQAALYEIVGTNYIAGQRPRIAAQGAGSLPRPGCQSRSFAVPLIAALSDRGHGAKVDSRCNPVMYGAIQTVNCCVPLTRFERLDDDMAVLVTALNLVAIGRARVLSSGESVVQGRNL